MVNAIFLFRGTFHPAYLSATSNGVTRPVIEFVRAAGDPFNLYIASIVFENQWPRFGGPRFSIVFYTISLYGFTRN